MIMTTSGEDLLKCAEALYVLYPQETTFRQDLDLHLRKGVVYSDGSLLLMAIPTHRKLHEAGFQPQFQGQPPDSWWISLAVGDLDRLVDVFATPEFYFPHVGWSRRMGGAKFYSWNQVWKKLIWLSQFGNRSRLSALRDTRSAVGAVAAPNLPKPPQHPPRLRLRRSSRSNAGRSPTESVVDSPAPTTPDPGESKTQPPQ